MSVSEILGVIAFFIAVPSAMFKVIGLAVDGFGPTKNDYKWLKRRVKRLEEWKWKQLGF